MLTRVCCVCQKIEKNQKWRARRTPPSRNVRVTHGYCPDCFAEALADIEGYINEQELLEAGDALRVDLSTSSVLCV